MLRHSTLDDIKYSNYSHSTRKSIKNRQRRRHHSSKSKRNGISSRNKRRNRGKSKFNFAIDTCAVCLDESHVSDTKLFPCGHSFHGQCLIQWVKQTKGRKFNCPLCRQDIAHFIQMTGDQQLNEELIQVWNEHYVYNSPSLTPEIAKDDVTEKDIACKQIDLDVITKPASEHSHSHCKSPCCKTAKCTKSEPTEKVSVILSIKEEDETTAKDVGIAVNVEQVEIPQNTVDMDTNEVIQKSDYRSIWKFIWKSPVSFLYQQTNAYIKQCIINSLGPVYDINVYNAAESKSLLYTHSNHYYPEFDAFTLKKTQKREYEELKHELFQTDTTHESLTMTPIIDNIDNPLPNLLNFSLLNLKSGILAGLCAGSTTFLMAQQIRHELLSQGAKGLMNGSIRNSFIPIMSETIPSVAVFFTSYEHIKRYLFDIDNVNNPKYHTFSQRFISAGIASSIAYYLPHIGSNSFSGKGLLPFRFAMFFGTFELSKDFMNTRHEQLNVFQVASSAAIGGTISHGLYYPLTQVNKSIVMNMDIIPPSMNGNGLSMNVNGINGTATARILYRGWVSSLSKFLPSCVVCSCAFEYSKRYFSE